MDNVKDILIWAINKNFDEDLGYIDGKGIDKILEDLFKEGYKIYPINFRDDSNYIKVC